MGGTAENIIAETVTLKGTMRALEPELFELMRNAMKRLLDGLEKGMRISSEVSFSRQVPPLVNDPAVLKRVIRSAETVLGEDNVSKMPEDSMGAEDFAYISSMIPSAHLRIGSRTPGTETVMIHKPEFSPDENFLGAAMKLVSRIAIDLTDEE